MIADGNVQKMEAETTSQQILPLRRFSGTIR